MIGDTRSVCSASHIAPYAFESVGLAGWSRSVVSGWSVTNAWTSASGFATPGCSRSNESKRESSICGPAPTSPTTLPCGETATLVGPVTSPSPWIAEGSPPTRVRAVPCAMTVTRPLPASPVPASAT